MCKFNPKNDARRIDPCMRKFIQNLNDSGIPTYSSCCGHGRYPMTVVVKEHDIFAKNKGFFDLISGVKILRTTKFYKKDKRGHYYIPEVSEEKK